MVGRTDGNDRAAGIRPLSLILVSLLMVVTVGCQSTVPSQSVRYNNVRFMDLWNTYTHCLAVDRPQLATLDASKLHEVSESQSYQVSIHDFVPNQFRKNLSQLSPRLAVDLHAMAAACSLHAGNLAASTGDLDLARAQFNQILSSQNQSQHPFYSEQARARLAALELSFQASLR